MKQVVVAAPAKLNLFLAITGRRADGFHDLVSVVAPVELGDTLRGEPADRFSLVCDDPAVPAGDTNLILQAAAAFAKATADKRASLKGAKFTLEKRIPMGAGLGGGSSDAVAALRVLNTLAGNPLADPALAEIAAGLGSDCALFLPGGPVVMRGRGDRVEPLASAAATRLRGQRVLIFKPDFSIATPWAYRAMAAQPSTYLTAAEAERRLGGWIGDKSAPATKLLFNNMEQAAFAKFLALPALLAQLGAEFALEPRMSGSGSACFAFLPDSSIGSGPVAVPVAAVADAVRAAWGQSAFIAETRIA